MTLFVTAADVAEVLDMPSCIDAMRDAFAAHGRGAAVNHPRQRYTIPPEPEPGTPVYLTNMIAGGLVDHGVAALRINSSIVHEQLHGGHRRRSWVYPDRRSWGFVLLFATDTGRPLAVYQDFAVSPLRVSATTAACADAAAPTAARTVGLFGSGNEAERHAEALCTVRDIERVLVFSPNEAHRRDFAERIGRRVAADVMAASAPEEVVEQADIVMCATNSSEPVFDGAWLRPGQFVASIVNSDAHTSKTEVDRTTFARSGRIIVNDMATARDNDQRELLDPMETGEVARESVVELGALLANHPVRADFEADGDRITYYKANAGVGIQFAAAGRLIYERCRAQGRGTEVPTELFGADVGWWLDRGFSPSP